MIYHQARFHNHVTDFWGHTYLDKTPWSILNFRHIIWYFINPTDTYGSIFSEHLVPRCHKHSEVQFHAGTLDILPEPQDFSGERSGDSTSQEKWQDKTTTKMGRGSTKNIQWFNMINHGFTKRGDPGDPKRHEIAISPCQLPARTQAWRGIVAAAPPPPSWHGYRVSCASRPRQMVICGGWWKPIYICLSVCACISTYAHKSEALV